MKNLPWPALVTGETGTGKELVARALHSVAPGSSGAFVPVDCAGLSPNLVENELFGHSRGSFTGAFEDREGLVAAAQGGTLFFDEIGELPLELQPKLLRVIQEREIRRLGDRKPRPVNVRIIAATNRDLAAELKSGHFRADLFYRLNVISIRVPPLRERRDDIPVLIDHFLSRCATGHPSISKRAWRALMHYDWPGNVRELENCVRRMVAFAAGPGLDLDELPPEIRLTEMASESRARVLFPDVPLPLAAIEMQAIDHTLALTFGHRGKAARLLGVGRTTVYRRLKEHQRHAEVYHPDGLK